MVSIAITIFSRVIFIGKKDMLKVLQGCNTSSHNVQTNQLKNPRIQNYRPQKMKALKCSPTTSEQSNKGGDSLRIFLKNSITTHIKRTGKASATLSLKS